MIRRIKKYLLIAVALFVTLNSFGQPLSNAASGGNSFYSVIGRLSVFANYAAGNAGSVSPLALSTQIATFPSAKTAEIKLYPNPTKQWLNVNILAKEQIHYIRAEVFDLFGRKLNVAMNKQVSNHRASIRLFLQDLAANNYLVKLTINSQTYTFKITKI